MAFSSKTDAIISNALYCTGAPSFPSDDPDMDRAADANLIDSPAAYRRAIAELEAERARLDAHLRIYLDLTVDLNETLESGDDMGRAYASLMDSAGLNDRFFEIPSRRYIRCTTPEQVHTIEIEYRDDAAARWVARPIANIIEFTNRPRRAE